MGSAKQFSMEATALLRLDAGGRLDANEGNAQHLVKTSPGLESSIRTEDLVYWRAAIRTQQICLAITLALSPLAGAFATVQYAHPDLSNGKVIVHSVLILETGAMVKRFGNVFGGEVLPDEGKQLEASLRETAEKVLQTKGCQFVADPYTPDALEKDPAAKSALAEVEASYRSLQVQIWKKPKDVQQARFTLGDGVAKLNPGHLTDAFEFIGAFGSLTTNGEKVKRVITGPGNTAREDLDIQTSLVDANTGAVLYYGKKITGGNFTTDPQLVQRGLEAVLENFNCRPHPAQ
jgi:hypothetical protein